MGSDYRLMTVKILSNLVDGVVLNEGVQHPELQKMVTKICSWTINPAL